MKSLPKFLLAIFAVSTTYTASAFNYAEADLLLVFRKEAFNDVEFNLGSVSNYLGKAAGTKLTVSNWDLGLVRSNFNNSLASVKFLLLAATSATDPLRRVWSTSAILDPSPPPTDLPGSQWGTLRSKVSFVGTEATANTGTNATQTYIVAPSISSSYSFIASDGGQVEASNIGGVAPFPVEAEIPATLLFYELKISNAATKPPAVIDGSFALDATGGLTFTAGPLTQGLAQPHIENITRSATTSTVSFTTTNGANYRLRFAAVLGGGAGGATTWTTLSTVVAGDGTTKTLTDTASDPQRFYSIEASR